MVATLQADTHPNTSTTTLDRQWRRMQGADGIREDYDQGGFAATLSTTAPTLTLASSGRSVLVDGNLLEFASDATLDPRDVGTQPAAGQSRIDLVVARYATAVSILQDRGTLAIKPGTPGATPTAPTATRTTGGLWEVPLHSYRLPASGLLTDLVDLRRWSGDHQTLQVGAELHGPIGSTRDQGGTLWRRVPGVGGSPSWKSSLTVTDLPEGGGNGSAIATGATATLAIVPMLGSGAPAGGLMAVEVQAEVSGGSSADGAAGRIWISTTTGSIHARKRWQWSGTQNRDMMVWTFLVPSPGRDINLQVIASVDGSSAGATFAQVKVNSQLIGGA